MSKRIGYLFYVFTAYLLIVSISLSAAEPQIPGQVLDWQKTAQKSIAQKNLTGAIESYQKVTEAFPNTAYAYDAWKQIASLNIQAKNFDQAQSAAMQLCRTYRDQPWVVQAVFDVVEKCMYAGAGTQALAICDEAESQFSPNSPSARFAGWRGMVLANQKDFTAARQITEKLQSIQSNAADYLGAMGNIGWGYYCVGQWEDAIVVYREGIARYPDHKGAAYLQYQVVKTCLSKKDIKAVRAEMETLQTRYGQSGLVCRLANDQYDIIKRFLWENKTDTADQWMDLFLKQYRQCDAAMGLSCKLAGIYRQKNQHKQAVAVYNRLLEQYPDNKYISEAQDALVDTYLEMKDLPKAQEAIKTDIEKYPGRSELLRMITHVAVETARSGDPNKAMELTQMLFDQKARGTDQLFAYVTKARVLVYQGKDTAAQKIVKDLMVRFNDDPNALVYHVYGVAEEYLLVAENLYKSGKTEEVNQKCQMAITVLDGLLDQNVTTKSVQQAWYSMGTAFRLMKDYKTAAEYYQAVMDLWPDYIHGWNAQYFIGYCYEELAKDKHIDPNQVNPLIERAYKKTIEKYPDGVLTRHAYLSLGDLCLRHKRYAEALGYYEQYQAKAKPNDPFQDRIKWDLAWLYDKTGDIPKSRAIYDQLIQTPDESMRQRVISKELNRRNQQEAGL